MKARRVVRWDIDEGTAGVVTMDVCASVLLQWGNGSLHLGLCQVQGLKLGSFLWDIRVSPMVHKWEVGYSKRGIMTASFAVCRRELIGFASEYRQSGSPRDEGRWR